MPGLGELEGRDWCCRGRGGSVFTVPLSTPNLHSTCFAASCTLMALASRDTQGERSGLWRPHEKRMSGVKVDVYPSFCPWLPQLPNALIHPSPLPSSVSIDIPGAVPEWLWWNLPNVLFTHGEYDRLWLVSRAPRSGWG